MFRFSLSPPANICQKSVLAIYDDWVCHLTLAQVQVDAYRYKQTIPVVIIATARTNAIAMTSTIYTSKRKQKLLWYIFSKQEDCCYDVL